MVMWTDFANKVALFRYAPPRLVERREKTIAQSPSAATTSIDITPSGKTARVLTVRRRSSTKEVSAKPKFADRAPFV